MTPSLAGSPPTPPTHDAIAREAHRLWQDRGCPAGCDDEIWLETERRMNEESQSDTSENPPSTQVAPALTEKDVMLDALQKQEARAPRVPHHIGPTSKPAVTGKPVWPKGHSN